MSGGGHLLSLAGAQVLLEAEGVHGAEPRLLHPLYPQHHPAELLAPRHQAVQLVQARPDLQLKSKLNNRNQFRHRSPFQLSLQKVSECSLLLGTSWERMVTTLHELRDCFFFFLSFKAKQTEIQFSYSGAVISIVTSTRLHTAIELV